MKLRSEKAILSASIKGATEIAGRLNSEYVKTSHVELQTDNKEEVDFDSSLSSLTSIGSSVDDAQTLSLISNSSSNVGKRKKSPSPKILKPKKSKPAKSFQPIAPPDNWKSTFLKIQEFRRTNLAPVDSMGCERVDQPKLTPKEYRFHVLVSLMLSSQTKDEITYKAMQNIREACKGQLTAEVIASMDEDTFHNCIRQVGFHNAKTKFIKKAAQLCLEKHDGDIPATIPDLIALPGVGPKMAFLAMQCAWDINAGIGVDVHVHRISNRLGWVKTKDPEQTRLSLESWFPQDLWKAVNFVLVGFGQVICYSSRPRCHACPVADSCPSRDHKASESRKTGPIRSNIIPGLPKILLEAEDV